MKLFLIFLLPLAFVIFCTFAHSSIKNSPQHNKRDRRLVESENARRLVLAPAYYLVITPFVYSFWVTGLDHPGMISFLVQMTGWSCILAIDAWGDRLPFVGERLAPAINEQRRARLGGFGKSAKPLVLEKL